MERVDYVRGDRVDTDEYRAVVVVADLLLEHLREETVVAEMLAANQPGRGEAHAISYSWHADYVSPAQVVEPTSEDQ